MRLLPADLLPGGKKDRELTWSLRFPEWCSFLFISDENTDVQDAVAEATQQMEASGMKIEKPVTQCPECPEGEGEGETAVKVPVEGSANNNSETQEQPLPPLLLTAHFIDLLSVGVSVMVVSSFLLTTGMTSSFIHILPHNLIACALAAQGISGLVSLNNFLIGNCFLSGLFFYDIFWVFCTPVMVAVATQLEAPAKIILPNWAVIQQTVECEVQKTMEDGSTEIVKELIHRRHPLIGLGDIVIPGLFLGLCLRFDVFLYCKRQLGGLIRSTDRDFHAANHLFSKDFSALTSPGAWQRKWTFWVCFCAYLLSLIATGWIMNFFNAAQPALLYICPALIIASVGSAYLGGNWTEMWNYDEESLMGHESAEDLREAERRFEAEMDRTRGKGNWKKECGQMNVLSKAVESDGEGIEMEDGEARERRGEGADAGGAEGAGARGRASSKSRRVSMESKKSV